MLRKLLGLLSVAVLATTTISCTERIDAGNEGIKVNLYGSDKGVDEVSLVTGRVWFNPLTTTVYEFPTYVQTYDYEPFTVNAKDGSTFTVDPTMSVSVVSGSTPKIFKKYRKSIDDIMSTTFGNHIKDVYRIEFNKYTTDEIISSREKFEDGIQKKMNAFFKTEGFHLEQLTSGIKPPKSITDAIELKNAATQKAQQAENELRVVEANAKKLIVQAQAEADANKIKQQTLTPLILQQMAIDRWDGKLPSTYSGNDLPFVKGL